MDAGPFRFSPRSWGWNVAGARERLEAELDRIRARHAAAAAAGYPTMPQEELSPLERLALLGEPDTPPGKVEAVERALHERLVALALRRD